MCQPGIYWLLKQRVLLFRGWQNYINKRNAGIGKKYRYILLSCAHKFLDTFRPKSTLTSLSCAGLVIFQMLWDGVLTRVSWQKFPCIFHVHKIMKAMHTVQCAKSRTRPQHISHYTLSKQSRRPCKYCERKVCIVFEHSFYFTGSFDEPGGEGAFEVCRVFLHFFMWVCIFKFLYTSFSNTFVQCTHLLKSSVTTDCAQLVLQHSSSFACVK